MFERVVAPRKLSIPLSLTSENKIIFPSKAPVYGWMSGQTHLAAQQWLDFSQALLVPAATSEITYACNLPSPFGAKSHGAPLDDGGMLPTTITSAFEREFLRLSLPGGQTELFGQTGERGVLKFRWVCISAERFIGAIWRCYIQIRQRDNTTHWGAIERDYFFCSDAGIALGASTGNTILTVGARGERPITLVQQALTQFECASGRVKVTRLCSSGWGRRELERLDLQPDGDVIAYFSDGKQAHIATAGIDRIELPRAA